MKIYLVKYTYTLNAQYDRRKKPVWETITDFDHSFYNSFEEAMTSCETRNYDSFEIYEAPLTLVKELEAAE